VAGLVVEHHRHGLWPISCEAAAAVEVVESRRFGFGRKLVKRQLQSTSLSTDGLVRVRLDDERCGAVQGVGSLLTSSQFRIGSGGHTPGLRGGTSMCGGSFPRPSGPRSQRAGAFRATTWR